MAHGSYDAIVAGAGFAGLSVASRIKGKILLIDRVPVGSRQTSACAAPYDVIEGIGCGKSALNVSNVFSLHINGSRIDFRLKRPYCTVDFKKFCQTLNSQNDAAFLKANVLKAEKRSSYRVYTSEGVFESGILVDATGWNPAVAGSLRPASVNKRQLMFGIETEAPYSCGEFHIYYEPRFIKDAMLWIFPCGGYSRFGIASYCGRTGLLKPLDSFLSRFGLRRGKIHGGFINYGFRDPVVDGVFLVGDAQGQALPVTGEGIRRCIKYGMKCGDIIQRILDGEMSRQDGLSGYSAYVLKARREHELLVKAQDRFLRMSEKGLEIFAQLLSKRPALGAFERRYRRI